MPRVVQQIEFSVAGKGPDAGAFAWSPDGARIAVLANMLRYATLFDARDGRALATIDDLAGGSGAIDFDGAGRVIVAPRRAAAAAVTLWEPESGAQRTVAGPSDSSGGSTTNMLVGFALDRARSRLVGVHRARSGRGFALRLALYDARQWTFVASGGAGGSRVAMAPDGTRAAVIGGSGQIDILDLGTGATIRRIVANRNAVRHLAWSADGTRLVTGAMAEGFGRDGGGFGRLHDTDVLQLWEVDSGRRLAAVTGEQLAGGVRALDTSPDGAWLAVSGCDGVVRLLDAATLQPVATLAEDRAGRPTLVRFSPDARRVALLDQKRAMLAIHALEPERR